jgi:hypothetical protein
MIELNTTETAIINNPDYRVIAKLREFNPNQWQLTFSTWQPETGWSHQQFILEPEELARFKELFA